MKLTRFYSEGLNHQRMSEFLFDEDLTFITGINGSGKTTVLNLISAVLTPDLERLADIVYHYFELGFEFEGKPHTFMVTKKDNSITIQLANTKSTFTFLRHTEDYDENSGWGEPKAEYYQNVIDESESNRVIAFIARLPAPTYLGLDRRSKITRQRRRVRALNRLNTKQMGIGPLAQSLPQAVRLAQDVQQEIAAERSRLDREFLRDLLLDLIQVDTNFEFGKLELPTEKAKKELSDVIKNLAVFPRVEGISAEDVRSRVDPALREAAEVISKLPNAAPIGKKGPPLNVQMVDLLIKWASLKPYMERFKRISDRVDQYNMALKNAGASTSSYLSLLNKFFGDSGKTVIFDERGRIKVQVPDGPPIKVEQLSSGEAQIFVILTHLSFNEAIETAGIFMVDEPELSLHVEWQEIFVQSLLDANPSIQYVLATHAPSIIMGRTENCRDLSIGVGGSEH